MAITVAITFVGLITFVQREEITHVVMPQTAGHEQHGTPQHEARLFFGEPILGSSSRPVPWSIPLDRTILRITNRGREPGAPPLPDILFDLSSVTEQPVISGLLDAPLCADRVNARVELDMHGTLEGLPPTALFCLKDDPTDSDAPGQPIHLASYARWTEVVDEGALHLSLTRFDNAGTGHSIDLGPARFPTGEGTLALSIYHILPEYMPPRVPPAAKDGQRIDHWGAMYRLFEAPARQPMPVFVEEVQTKGIVPNTCGPTRASS